MGTEAGGPRSTHSVEPLGHRSTPAADGYDEDEVSQYSYTSASGSDECISQSLLDSGSDSDTRGFSRECAERWRTDRSMQEDYDFAHYFLTWKEAYNSAGQAVAAAWERAAFLSGHG